MSGIPHTLKPLATLCQVKVIQYHKVKRSRCEFLARVVGYMFLGWVFAKNVDSDPQILSWTFQIGEKLKIA